MRALSCTGVHPEEFPVSTSEEASLSLRVAHVNKDGALEPSFILDQSGIQSESQLRQTPMTEGLEEPRCEQFC